MKLRSGETVSSSMGKIRLSDIRQTRAITRVQIVRSDMAREEGTTTVPLLDEVMEDIRRDLVRRVAAADRDANRDVYDALEVE